MALWEPIGEYLGIFETFGGLIAKGQILMTDRQMCKLVIGLVFQNCLNWNSTFITFRISRVGNNVFQKGTVCLDTYLQRNISLS